MTDMTEEEWARLTDDLLRHTRAMEVARASHTSKLDMRGMPAVLHLLYHNPEGLTPTQIAQQTRVSTARVAATLNVLEQQGLVVRKNDSSDRRRIIVRITPAGEENLVAHKAQVLEAITDVLKQLGPDDARELDRIIGRLSRIVGAEPQDLPRDPCPSGCPRPQSEAVSR